MDKNADPCDNFYKFACGGFVKKTKISDDRTHESSLQMVEDVLEERLHASLAEDIQPNELRAFKLAKNLYRSCMNDSEFQVSLFYRFT